MSLVRPWRCVCSVDLIDVDALVEQGVRCVLLDRDNTIVPRDTKVAPAAVRRWLDSLHAAGIAVCMVSNNYHGKAVTEDAEKLGCAVVHHAMKPAPLAVHVALAVCGVPAEQTVLVGDQLFTDMVAGNLAGVRTILVRPQSTTDLWYTKLFRIVEGHLLAGAVFEGEEPCRR